MDQELFNPQSSSVTSSRILYTPSTFARTSLLHLQEAGSLQAIHPHTSTRTNLTSFLCFVVLSGNGTLLMEGERRMEHNRNKTSGKFENTVLECDDSDWSAAVMVDFMDDCKAEVLADKELKRLYAAMSKLTERQMEIIQLYYYKGMNQEEVAEELGISQRAVSYSLEGALKKIRKNF